MPANCRDYNDSAQSGKNNSPDNWKSIGDLARRIVGGKCAK